MERNTAETYPSGFYVYQLVDPRTGLPFYVGKGQRGRAWQHQRQVEAGFTTGNARKVRKITEIIQSGADVEVVIVAQYELESDALDHEFRLVDADPTLTNIAPGGIGRVSSPEALELLRKRRMERLRLLRKRERAERDARRLAEHKRRMLSVAGAERYAGEIEGWIVAHEAARVAKREAERESALRRASLPPRVKPTQAKLGQLPLGKRPGGLYGRKR